MVYTPGMQMNEDDDRRAVRRMERLGRAGFLVSVCFGPCGLEGSRWTVQVLMLDGSEFDRPFAADTFAAAIDIVELELARRGWLPRI